MTERLDRIEAVIEANSVAIAELNQNVNSLTQVVEVHQHNFEISQHNFEVIMQEIKGIRTESQRILEHLFGSQES
jgi:hypothetical protein